MTIFASKIAFLAFGLERITPSTAHMSQDCFVCKCPLDITGHTATAPHRAVRIIDCGHTHGQECLEAWLNTGNSCPTCKRMLFEASGSRITQAEIDSVVRTVGRLVGKSRVMMSIARVQGRQKFEQARLQCTKDEELKLKADEAESRQEDAMDDDYWMQSDGEEDFGLDEEDGDGDFVMDDEDEAPESASV